MAQYKQDSLEEISMIQQELMEFGIRLLPPDLIKSKLQFSIEGQDIRFGLSAIKGISNKSIGNVQDFVNTETANKFEAFQAARQAGLNIGVLSAFIQAGALDSLDDNRPRMVLESQIWNLLTIPERIYCLENGALHKWNLLEMVKNITEWKNDKGKNVARATRLGTIKKKYLKYKEIYLLNKKSPDFAAYVYEKKLLGYSYSQSLKKIFSGEMGIDLMSIDEIKAEAENLSVECIAEVVEAKMGTSKNGNKYLKIVCRDESGSFNFMILGDKLAQYLFQHKAPAEEGFIYIKGRKGADIVWIDRMTVLDSRVYMKLSDLRDVEIKEENILETVEKPR
jgi:DNA polymerase III alpha subunit